MDLEELQEIIEEAKDNGLEDEDILGGLYSEFVKGELDLENFKKCVDVLGYKLSDEFLALDNIDEQRKFGLDENTREAYDKYKVQNPTDSEEPREPGEKQGKGKDGEHSIGYKDDEEDKALSLMGLK